MSTKYIDREGFEWDKHCMVCDHYELHNYRKDNTTTCRSFGVPMSTEPARSYEEAGNKRNTCPNFLKAC